jgi:hypothetical protein
VYLRQRDEVRDRRRVRALAAELLARLPDFLPPGWSSGDDDRSFPWS